MIENILSVVPKDAGFGFYRTSAGAELDLVISYRSQLWAIDIKRTLNPKLSKGFLNAVEDVEATNRFFVYAGKEEFPLGESTMAIGLNSFLKKINSEWGKG